MKRFFFLFLTVVCSPLIIVMTLAYGFIVGIIGCEVGLFQLLKRILQREITENKKYKKWLMEKEKASHVATQITANPGQYNAWTGGDVSQWEAEKKPFNIYASISIGILVWVILVFWMVPLGLIIGPAKSFPILFEKITEYKNGGR